jgi:hypothetical protein
MYVLRRFFSGAHRASTHVPEQLELVKVLRRWQEVLDVLWSGDVREVVGAISEPPSLRQTSKLCAKYLQGSTLV